jgi:hypothetical protein
MKEPYGEGLATHTDPESCAAACEGRGEAYDRGTSRQSIEPRKVYSGCRRSTGGRKATFRSIAIARCFGTRAVGDL